MPPKEEKKSAPLITEKDGYYIWDKGVVAKLSSHFSTKEMTCRCSFKECVEQRISKDLINRLESVRTDLGQPMIVTSAFRCGQHQAHLRASGASTVVAKKSTHELGDAVDVVPKDGQGVRDSFLAICEKHFESIGLSNKFLHLDLRSGKRRWEY